jgi:hypothetical protein
MNTKLLQSLVQEYNEIAEGYNLSKDDRVEHDAASAEFAKHYVSGHKGDHSTSPSPKHEKDSEHFHSTYSTDHVRTGFGGSGTSVYQHKTTGDKFQVNRTASGKGFHGTNHTIKKL